MEKLGSVVLLTAMGVWLAGCGSESSTGAHDDDPTPTVMVTTALLGQLLEATIGDVADVQVVIPPDADPHTHQLSAREAAAMREASAIVVSGAGLEGQITDTISAAESDGVAVCTAVDGIEPLAAAHDHRADEGGDTHTADDESGDGDQVDPHFFTDPLRVAVALEHVVTCLAQVEPALDTPTVVDAVEREVTALTDLDAEIQETLAGIDDERRNLVVNHDVFAYLADRYGFEVVGVVLSGGATHGSPDAASMADLAVLMRERGIPVLFSDVSAPDSAARTVADEAGGVEVVELYTESLGPSGSGADTYAGMMRVNAERIAEALG